MRVNGGLLLALLVGTTFLLAPGAPVEAQRGGGGGKGRGNSKETTQQAPPAEPALGEYSTEHAREVVERGEGRQALANYERVAAQAEQQGDPLTAARANAMAAHVAWRLGSYQKTIRSGTRSLDLYKRAGELQLGDLKMCASVYSQVGLAYRQVGDLAQAGTVLEAGLTFARTQLRGRQEDQAVGFLLRAAASVANGRHEYQTALAHASEANQLFEGLLAHLGRKAPDRAQTNLRRQIALSLAEMGRAQIALGRYDEADASFDRALKYSRLVGLREVEIQILQGQGALAQSRQDWQKALASYQQARTLATQINRTGSLPYLNTGMARALDELGRTDEALAASREAVQAVEELRADLADAELRSGYFEDKQGIYQLAVRLALKAQQPDEAFALSERSRARAFLDLLGSQTTLSKGRTRALVAEELQLRARLAEARAPSPESGDGAEAERSRTPAEAAERDYRAFIARVRKENLEQASLMSVEPVTMSEIQGLLPEGTTLLEYLVEEKEVIVWVVDRQRSKVVRIPADRQALINQVRQFRGAIASQAPLATVQARAQALYRQLLGAARPEIRGDRLLIVPHGVLHYLPFTALRSPDGRWVVEDFAVSTLPSASVLRYLSDKGAGASTRALVIGNPDLGPELALPWAEREARMIGQRERNATVLVRADATEVEVKKLVEGAGLVHFASHGELNQTDPLSSALLLVPGGGEDGRLEVRELFGLDLHARLVVLSACETGLGKLSRGDEIVGLQRAFLYAGTPAVVTTLWKVDDRASYELIRAFYSRLDGAGAVEALRQAQLETQRAFPHPFAWAAFVLTGVPR